MHKKILDIDPQPLTKILCSYFKEQAERLGIGWNATNKNGELIYFEAIKDYLANSENDYQLDSEIIANKDVPDAILVWYGNCDFFHYLLSLEDAIITYANVVLLPDNASFEQIVNCIELTKWESKQ